MRKSASPTPAEFELMEVLWEIGEGSVRDVWDRVRTKRDVAYTTVMTVLDKLRRKQVLAQRRVGKAYFYRPLIDRQKAVDLVLREVAESYFHGSAAELRSFLDRGEPAEPPSGSEPSQASESSRRMDEFLL